MVDTIIRAGAVLLAGVFGAAVVHKAYVLFTGSTQSQPLLRVSARRAAYAAPILALAGMLELAIAALLATVPQAGLPAAAALMTYYALELRRLPRDESCRCFGSLSGSTSRDAAIRRNVVLTGLCVLGSAGYLAGAVERVELTQASLGIAVVGAAVVLAPAALRAYGLPPNVPAPNPEEG